jgi:holin-like protein
MATGQKGVAGMDVLRGFAWLLLCQSLGELVSKGLGLGLPGPVVGMLLMLLALNLAFVRRPVAVAADALLAHLSLLFVPVGVGVIAHLPLLSQYGPRLVIVMVLSTLLGIAATALLLRHLWRRGI